MSSIARQLCDEVSTISPVITISNDSNMPAKKTKAARSCPSTSLQSGKTTRSVTIEKKRVVNQITPKGPDKRKATVETKEKSREILFHKHMTDTSVNTLCSGPMKCDSKCLTSIRRKTDSCSCKPKNTKQLLKASTADVRLKKKNLVLDKACYQCVDTVSCGTQFMDGLKVTKFSDNFGKKNSDEQSEKQWKDASVAVGGSLHCNTIKYRSKFCHDYFHSETQKHPEPSHIKLFMGARRWSLSKYATRGPDF